MLDEDWQEKGRHLQTTSLRLIPGVKVLKLGGQVSQRPSNSMVKSPQMVAKSRKGNNKLISGISQDGIF